MIQNCNQCSNILELFYEFNRDKDDSKGHFCLECWHMIGYNKFFFQELRFWCHYCNKYTNTYWEYIKAVYPNLK